MVAFRRLSSQPYEMECIGVDVNQVCNREKLFPLSWITEDGTDVTEEFIQYALPLIQGEPERTFSQGRPVYLYRAPKQEK